MTVLLALALANILSAEQAPDPRTPWEVLEVGPGSIAVPRGWRNLDGLRPRTLVFRQGDGIGIPLLDDTGQPLQAGLVVEQLSPATERPHGIAAEIMARAHRDSRLQPLTDPEVAPLKLSDSTEAVLLTSVYVKEGRRQSLQLKLITRSSDSRIWIVSAFLVGGEGSRWCTVDSNLGSWLRAHVLSLTFSLRTLDEDRLREAYRRKREQ